MWMENIGLNSEVAAGGKTFHVQTQYLEPTEKVVSSIFDDGKVIYNSSIEIKSNTPINEIKQSVNRLHHNVIGDLELIFYISDKVQTIRHPISNNKLGIVFLKRNLFNEAIKEFKKAIEIDSDYVEAYNNLGYVYLKQKNYQEAIDAFSRALTKDNNYADLYNNLGYAYFCVNNYGKAFLELNKAIEINNNYIAAIFNLCQVYLKTVIDKIEDSVLPAIPKRIEKVKDLLSNLKLKAIYFKPQAIDNVLEHLVKNNLSEAFKIIEKAGRELPEYLNRYLESEFYLKFMFGGKGKDELFIHDYAEQLKEAIAKYPGYPDLRNNLGIAFLIQCRNLFLNALEEFRAALKINPDYKKAEKNLKLAENDGKGFLILLRAILK